MEFLTSLNQLLWGSGLVGLLLGTGAFCHIYGGFQPLRSLRLLGKKHRGSGTQSVFQACMTSLAAAMGTGNIAGVGTALTLGGAGAVFWMWVAALLGMGLIYAENVLGCHYRRGEIGGAAAYLRYGIHPALGTAFAVCCVAASFGMGNMTQSHAMAQTLQEACGIPAWVTGLAAGGITAAVIFGGAKRIGQFAAAVVPVLTAVYLFGAGVVIWHCRDNLGAAVLSIFRGAFGWQAAAGGIAGEAVRRAVSVGVRRGVFSNEAGLGSSSMLHSSTEGAPPAFLGACGMLEVAADTFLCCTATALAVLSAGVLDTGADGAGLVLLAFRKGMGSAADVLLPPVIALFALCTLVGWSHCGSSALRSIAGQKWVTVYRAAFCLAAVVGAVMRLETVWLLADIANAGMAYCNLPGILLLYPQIIMHRNTKKSP